MTTGITDPAELSASPLEPGAPSHRPEPRWKVRGTRKPLAWWDRIKFLLLLNGLYALLVWNEYLRIEPLGTVNEATAAISRSQTWLIVLIVAEFVRQVHFRISEISPGYHAFWTRRVFGRWNNYTQRRFSAWTRFRLMRVALVLF
jgi:cell division protease FtsH